jgi:hypothetical protein
METDRFWPLLGVEINARVDRRPVVECGRHEGRVDATVGSDDREPLGVVLDDSLLRRERSGVLRPVMGTMTVMFAVSALSSPAAADLDAVAAELNGRPRQTLGWKTPSQALDEALR